MRSPRPLTGALLAALTVAAGVSGVAGGPAAFADTPSTVYVDHDVTCSDTGTGTQALPFCTIQAAANAVLPGQTVRITGTTDTPYTESVTLTRSGTASQPVVFTGTPGTVVENAPGKPVFSLMSTDDVTLRSMTVRHDTAEAVYVGGVRDVTLDRLDVVNVGTSESVEGIALQSSSDVTISRSRFEATHGVAIDAEFGDSDITVTTNEFHDTYQGGVEANSVNGIDLTSNTFDDPCSYDATLASSPGSVENNLFTPDKATQSSTCLAPGSPSLVVAGTALSQVTVDYNAFGQDNVYTRSEYSWGGTRYTTPGMFLTGTGQGAHDIITGFEPSGSTPVNSADSSAPGELTTDIDGNPHVNDPDVADTGAGPVRYADRGATETEDTVTLPASVTATPARGAVPFTASVPVGDATSAWGEPLTFSVDFGDGSDPVTGTADDPPAHTYTTPGTYTETVTATNADGYARTRSAGVTAATAAPAALTLSTAPLQMSTGYLGSTVVPVFSHTDDFEMTGGTIDFGDGTDLPALDWTGSHPYTTPGQYTVTLKETDVLGRTSSVSTTFNATDAYALTPSFPAPGATIPAHGTWTMAGSVSGHYTGLPMEMRVNVTGAKNGGWLTAYAAGTTRPSASTLNFPAGENASNQETIVPNSAGAVTFYNGASAPITVNVQVIGEFGIPDGGDAYHPTNPITLLDTRYGTGGITGPVGAGKSVTVTVAGKNGVPADADAVTLDVAENTTKASGSLTVAPFDNSGIGVTASYWATGESVTNLVTLPLTAGKVTLTNNSKGTANVIAALDGWYSTQGTGSGALPVTPVRVLNTQTGLGEPGGTPLQLAPGATLKVKVAGTAGLPATGLTAADLNLTVSAPTASGWLVAYPDGTTRPTAGALNYTKGHTIAGQAMIKVGTDGYVDLYNPTKTAIDVFADIHGAFLPVQSSS